MTDYIFGIQSIKEAIRSQVDLGKNNIHKVLIRNGLKNAPVGQLLQDLKSADIPTQYVPEEKLNKICKENHQGVIAIISPIEYQNIEQVLLQTTEKGGNPLIVVLDGITDVRNFGGIARTAVCADCDAILIPESGNAGVSSDAIKASAGALNHIPVCRYKHIKDTIFLLQQYGLRVVAATEKAKNDFYENDFTIPTAIIMGSEGKGLSNSSLRNADELLKIPLKGPIESLNVSISASLFIYEALRQRRGI